MARDIRHLAAFTSRDIALGHALVVQGLIHGVSQVVL